MEGFISSSSDINANLSGVENENPEKQASGYRFDSGSLSCSYSRVTLSAQRSN